MTRVLIAAASEAARSWFAQVSRRSGPLAIVRITTRDASLSAHVQELAPEVVVIDATDSERETIASSLESVGDPAIDVILVLSDQSWHAAPSELMRAGVRAVLSPQPTAEELEATVRAVRAGFVVFEPRVLEALVRSDDREASEAVTTGSAMRTIPAPRLNEPLTPREIDVLNALAEGLGNKQIAARLAISEHTVKTHLAAIFEKLEVSNRTEAVMAGARLGLVLL